MSSQFRMSSSMGRSCRPRPTGCVPIPRRRRCSPRTLSLLMAMNASPCLPFTEPCPCRRVPVGEVWTRTGATVASPEQLRVEPRKDPRIRDRPKGTPSALQKNTAVALRSVQCDGVRADWTPRPLLMLGPGGGWVNRLTTPVLGRHPALNVSACSCLPVPIRCPHASSWRWFCGPPARRRDDAD